MTCAGAQCPRLRKTLLGLTLCSCYLEILSNFILEIMFQIWSLVGQGSMWESREDMPNMSVHLCSSLPHLYFVLVIPMSIEYQWTHDVWEFIEAQSQYQVSLIHLRPRKGDEGARLTVPKCHTFSLNQNLLWEQKEGNGDVLLSCISQPLMLKIKT